MTRNFYQTSLNTYQIRPNEDEIKKFCEKLRIFLNPLSKKEDLDSLYLYLKKLGEERKIMALFNHNFSFSEDKYYIDRSNPLEKKRLGDLIVHLLSPIVVEEKYQDILISNVDRKLDIFIKMTNRLYQLGYIPHGFVINDSHRDKIRKRITDNLEQQLLLVEKYGKKMVFDTKSMHIDNLDTRKIALDIEGSTYYPPQQVLQNEIPSSEIEAVMTNDPVPDSEGEVAISQLPISDIPPQSSPTPRLESMIPGSIENREQESHHEELRNTGRQSLYQRRNLGSIAIQTQSQREDGLTEINISEIPVAAENRANQSLVRRAWNSIKKLFTKSARNSSRVAPINEDYTQQPQQSQAWPHDSGNPSLSQPNSQRLSVNPVRGAPR